MNPTEAAAVVRTLLLTDVVDSTKLAEKLGDARMAEVWAAHDRLARDLLARHGGREVDKSDGFLLLFDQATGAAFYAIDYHAALRSLDPPLSARAGLHVGEVTLRENSPADVARGAKPLEVEGLAKPVAARVMSVALAGQTLVTSEAREELRASGLRVQSHGHWRMKGIAEPLELFEVGDDSSPWQPPPDGAKVYRVVERHGLWVPRRDVRCVLPAEADEFLGREQDLAALAELVHGAARLVTLTGPGGTGKTRLARRFGWTWVGDYPGGVWYCDLAEARSVEGICGAVASVLDVPLGKDDPVVQLGHAIAGRGPALVILDNFEQVVQHAAATVGRWVERAGEAVFLVTSRERLALPHEHLVAVDPLPEDPAVRLFEARAKAQDAKFAVTDANRADIEAVVRTLDGLPLAIELAAARSRVLNPAELRARLKDRFKLLAGARGTAARQATLLAAIEWSWDLLLPWEKSALAQCSAFAGGFTMEAAEAVLDLSAWPAAPPVLDVVQALVDKSLLRVQSGRHDIDETYFGMYVSIHEHAAAKLRTEGAFEGSGPAAEEAAWARHGEHFARFGTPEALDALDTHGGVERRRRLAAELENLVAACRRALARADTETAISTSGAAGTILRRRGPIAAAVELHRVVLSCERLEPAQRLRVLQALGAATWSSGRWSESRELLTEALSLARELRERSREGSLVHALGTLDSQQGRTREARENLEAALAIHREAGRRYSECLDLGSLGILHQDEGRLEEARTHYEAALAIAREIGSRLAEGSLMGSLGLLHRDRGRVDEARSCLQASLLIAREADNRIGAAAMLNNLGALQADCGYFDEARSLHEEALALDREMGSRTREAHVLGNIGNCLNEMGRLADARPFHESALAIHREAGNRPMEAHVLGNLAALCAAEGRLEEAQAHLEEAQAIRRETGSRVGEAHALLGLGQVALLQGRLDVACARCQTALAIFREAGSRRDEGLALGTLGGALLAQDHVDESRACLERGERMLREVHDLANLAELLATRARLEWKAGNLSTARAVLADAESLAADSGLDAATEIGKTLAEVRVQIEGAPS